ncbi:Na(+)/H(+) antiporter subunit C [compost metagenome]|uniref:Na(+)/H(+) antiporter subunit C n=2 Tax=Cellulomonadaceae TaxID=85016 RepID=A0A163Q6E2_9CELL|nr:Na(+)/H(+) antiporter subunit C [Oerskovia enterophila]OCI33217.1 Na(+)/H(+) antiporter subunit C [Oerskovia enterophila]
MNPTNHLLAPLLLPAADIDPAEVARTTDSIDMTPSLVLVLAIGVLFATGVYLLLERSLTRVLIGFILIGNGANLMFLVAGGRAGGAPIIGKTEPAQMSDPLVQAMVLTAIVITLGLTAFVLAMAYRSWQLHGHDEVQDDLEDRRVARHAARNAPAFEDSDTEESGATLDDEAAEVYDETDGDGDGETDARDGNRPGPDKAARRQGRPGTGGGEGR